MKRLFLSVLVVLTTIFVLAGCAQPAAKPTSSPAATSTSTPTPQKITIRIASESTPGGGHEEKWAVFTKALEKELPGRAEIKYYGSATLYGDPEAFIQLRKGNLEINQCNMGRLAAIVDPRIAVTDVPGIFPSFDAMRHLFETDFGKELQRMAEASGLRLAAATRSNAVGIVLKDGPARSPADVKGKLIRGFSPVIHKPMMEGWGASFTFVGAAELASALQTGLIDGVYTSVYGWKITRDPGRFFTPLKGHATLASYIVSPKWWSSLPSDMQTAINKAFNAMLDFDYYEQKPKEEKDVLDAAPFGGPQKYQCYYMTDAEDAVWKAATQKSFSQMESIFGTELMNTAKKFAATAK